MPEVECGGGIWRIRGYLGIWVGAASVANTMAMSITQRQGEFGLSSTVGWSPVRALCVSGYVSPSMTARGLGRGLLVGVAIGVLGGIYHAWRVTRHQPLRALSGAVQ
jgi:ABC-type antimicrobial peptide transport system permease subunit